jgi:hypothetical protein
VAAREENPRHHQVRHATLRIFGALLIGALPLACASAAPPAAVTAATPSVAKAPVAESVDPTEGPVCSVVCEGTKVTSVTVSGAAIADAESFSIQETENADTVLQAMHDDLVACYKARVRVMPTAEGTLSLDVLIGPDGAVRKIDATGSSALGTAKDCVVKRVQRGTFDPPHAGGTLRIHVPLTLRREAPGEST